MLDNTDVTPRVYSSIKKYRDATAIKKALEELWIHISEKK
jgi:hypothetical protein